MAIEEPSPSPATSHKPEANHSAKNQDNVWVPGKIRRLPWLGLGALSGVVIAIFAALGVLVASNGQPVDSWSVQPTVFLALASAASNILLHFAFLKGVTIAWWGQASKSDNKVGDLHRTWDHGNNLWGAVTAGRRFNVVALACILVAVTPINNVLLQRAARSVGEDFSTTKTDLRVPVARRLPQGYSASTGQKTDEPSLFTGDFSEVIQAASDDDTIRVKSSGCTGRCNATIQGAGLVPSCKRHKMHAFHTLFETAFLWNQTKFGRYDCFGHEFITLNIAYQGGNASTCDNDLTVNNCTFSPAIVQYPVEIDGDGGAIRIQPRTTMYDDKVVEKSQYTYHSAQCEIGTVPNTTFGGFALGLNNLYASNAYQIVGLSNGLLETAGSMSNRYAHGNQDASRSDVCKVYFTDPSQELLQAVRELMFRSALASATASDRQHVTAHQVYKKPIFRWQSSYLVVALIVTGLAVMAVLPLYNGYWNFGRNVSMSPVEIAKAFGAPTLQGVNPNAEAKGLVGAVGSREVRYGVVGGADEDAIANDGCKLASTPDRLPQKLEVEESGLVREPKAGERFVG